MAFPQSIGLLPAEVAFICEMELVTVVPRQRLERLDLLSGTTPPLNPPQRVNLPLWLALLLKRQRRANILPPSWLHPDALAEILELETQHFRDTFSPAPTFSESDEGSSSTTNKAPDRAAFRLKRSFPFHPSATADASPAALPYHWLEVAEQLLAGAADDVADADAVRRLVRDVRDVRRAKMRRGFDELNGGADGLRLDGVGAMELSESRGFVAGVVDGLRKLGGARERESGAAAPGGAGSLRQRTARRTSGLADNDDYDDDDDMMG